MCGIIGYIGGKPATPFLLEGLKRMEYRGYDSAGVAILDGTGIQTRRAAGKIAKLEALLAKDPAEGHTGIGHTRWATHGPPTERNAHPHLSADGTVAVVHNGIIENAGLLKVALQDAGYEFRSDTDTEVIAHLVQELFEGSLEEAVINALQKLEGTYGLAVVSSRDPGKIVAARKGSPLLIGIGEHEHFLASDASAILAHTRQVVYLDDGDVAVIEQEGYRVLDINAMPLARHVNRIDWELGAIERGGFAHFMLKEIFEQPQTVQNTMRGRLIIEDGTSKLGGLNLSHEQLMAIDKIIITACGTSWHSGLIGKIMIEELCRIPVDVEYASEFRYRNPIVDEHTLCIVMSQSGETADTLAAMREAKRRGARTLGLVNVVGSTIAREDDGGIYLHAGPEIGVASTKAFTTQLTALSMLVIALAKHRTADAERERSLVQRLIEIPSLIEKTLTLDGVIYDLAKRFADKHHALFLGRGALSAIAMEGALKLKEISYIHAEAYAAGELKHGPLALVDADMPVITVAPNNDLLEKLKSNLQEVRARGGELIVFADPDSGFVSSDGVTVIQMPKHVSYFQAPAVYTVPLQLLAYHVAILKGTDVDQPRNLAKSVTVE